ncbi:MATE family efflux transporter [Treponema sp.]|uniref:MATE family efflux transporter n=1 Tax=Treponema sp. TaxID=166 RepID=UPI0025803E76|nr:MATE family efflux transporter [Treponema sp.]MBE6355123.1 MATE family efflux transporter [Treponema sp.]
MNKNIERVNPLASEGIGSLIFRFSVPSIIAMLVSGLYNIVDQIFIGHYVGELGNAATNIAFPMMTMCMAFSLLYGIGGAAAFNLSMGAGNKEAAVKAAGNSVSWGVLTGIVLAVLSSVFLKPLLVFFGSTRGILPFAVDYTRIVVLGFPFLILSVCGGHLIRGDGKPGVAMICNLTGAVANTVLDALFVIGFGWGMKGAAAATVIGQFLGAAIVVYHLAHFRTVKLTFEDFVPRVGPVLRIANLGMSQGFNQVAMMIVQVVSNNSFKHYGSLSVYGNEIPIAVVGIATKIAMLYFSVCIGLTHAMQPVVSFNYGAGDFTRVRKAFSVTRNAGSAVSIITFVLLQLFPEQIISVFGKGSALYVDFAVRYIRIFLFCTFINNIQPLTSTFFSAIGKPKKGLFLSLTRQILFLLPLLIILPLFMGINGLLYAGLIADFMAFAVSVLMIFLEFTDRKWQKPGSAF